MRRVRYSAYGAEIVAGATAKDRDSVLEQGKDSPVPNISCVHQMRTEFKALFDSVIKIEKFREYRLRQTVEEL